MPQEMRQKSIDPGICPVLLVMPGMPAQARPWGVEATTISTRAGPRTAGAIANSLKLGGLVLPIAGLGVHGSVGHGWKW